MITSGGPLGGNSVSDVPDGTSIDLPCDDPRGRLARYTAYTDPETGQQQAIFAGLVQPPAPPVGV
jgi:hypothetical protein